jgi:clathrin heavy chain
VGYQPDYAALLQHITRLNPEQGAEFAGQLVNNESGPLVDLERVTDIFQGQNMIQQATSFLLEALKDNKPEQGHLQVRSSFPMRAFLFFAAADGRNARPDCSR